MPNQIMQVFNGVAVSNNINVSFGFIDASYIYLVGDGLSDVEVDISLVIFIEPTVTRSVRLENDNILDSTSISVIPDELKNSPYNMQVAFTVSENIQLTVNAVRVKYSGEDELRSIKFQLNRMEAVQVVTSIGELVTTLANGFIDALVGNITQVLLPNLIRKGLTILLPSSATAAVEILFDLVTQAVLEPGQYFVDDTNFTGAVSMRSIDGSNQQISYREVV